MSFSGATAVELTVLFHHHDLALLLHFVRVLLHMVEDTPVVLLGDAHELVEDDMRKASELVVQPDAAPYHVRVLKPHHRCMKAGWVRHRRDETTVSSSEILKLFTNLKAKQE